MKALLFEGHDYVPAAIAARALLNTDDEGHARIEICNDIHREDPRRHRCR